MTYNILTTQPKIYESFLNTGLIARGLDKKIIKTNIINLYDYGLGKHKSIDDTPYGGGPGMILRVDVMADAITKLKEKRKEIRVILLTPQGKRLDQKIVKRLSKEKELLLISGRFEGYDERIRDLVDEEISIGDYILTSGDLPAMVLIDAISRQVPGFIEKPQSLKEESFNSLKISLEYPQYTRPEIFNHKRVPEVLLSGNHQKIAQWRREHALKKTRKLRSEIQP